MSRLLVILLGLWGILSIAAALVVFALIRVGSRSERQLEAEDWPPKDRAPNPPPGKV